MVVGVLKETFPEERRVALVPSAITALKNAGFEILVAEGAGIKAAFPDSVYIEKGARIISGKEIISQADIILAVRAMGADLDNANFLLELLRPSQVLIGLLDPYKAIALFKDTAKANIVTLALEFIPRISRAQSMDVLSSMAMVSGYKAALLAANISPKMFPMMITAAGTIIPAKVLVIGAGVAGLQAIATAHRLGAAVSAYDVRPEVKEQVESVGGKFVELPLQVGAGMPAPAAQGYAVKMDDDFYRRLQELLASVIINSNVIVTTAHVMGKKSPILITSRMVKKMQPGSVIVDLAVEQGGNCELTKPNETIVFGGVTIMGPVNLASTSPYDASNLFSKNITNFLLNIFKNNSLNLDDEIVKETLVTYEGKIVNQRMKEMIGDKKEHT